MKSDFHKLFVRSNTSSSALLQSSSSSSSSSSSGSGGGSGGGVNGGGGMGNRKGDGGSHITNSRQNVRNIDTDEAMSQIVQLDKGLRSTSVSQHCESIMQFSDIITRYPVPAIVNASLLRLADLFRSTESNFVRYWIANVFHTVRGELTKVLNRGELIKRVSTVLGSNDPIARALTLKILTSMSSILHDRIDLHHRIETRLLNAVEPSEYDAAIEAVERLCAISRAFAAKVLPELEKQLFDFDTPMTSKLKLMSVLKYMHGNARLVQEASDICARVMRDYPATDFCIAAIETLSHLAGQSVTIVGSTTEMLFMVLDRDPRKQVKICCLRNISKLCKTLSVTHTLLFSADILLKQLTECPHINIHAETLNLLRVMSGSSFVVQRWFEKNPAIARPIEMLCYHSSAKIALLSIEIMINLLRFGQNNSGSSTAESLFSQDELLANAICLQMRTLYEPKTERKQWNSDVSNDIVKQFSLPTMRTYVLELAIRLLRAFPGNSMLISATLINLMDHLSQHANQEISTKCKMLARCLHKCALIAPNATLSHTKAIVNLIDHTVSSGSQVNEDTVLTIILLFGCLFRSHCEQHATDSWRGTIDSMQQTVFLSLRNKKWHWITYRIAVEALRTGLFDLALQLLAPLQTCVDSEVIVSWISGLVAFSKAESTVIQIGDLGDSNVAKGEASPTFDEALSQFSIASNLFRYCAPSFQDSDFQLQYTDIRHEMVSLLGNMLLLPERHGKESPTAALSLEAHSARFEKLEARIRVVRHAYYDIDRESHASMFYQEVLCRSLCRKLAAISTHAENMSTTQQHSSPSRLDQKRPAMHVNELDPSLRERFLSCRSQYQGIISVVSMEENLQGIQQLAYGLLARACYVPHYFFNTGSHPVVQLETYCNEKPVAKSLGKPITAKSDHGLVLKFSGFIMDSLSSKRNGRMAQTVVIKVGSVLKRAKMSTPTRDESDQRQEKHDQKRQQQQVEKEEQVRARIMHGAFSTDFVCRFATEGYYELSISAHIVDQEDVWWYCPSTAQTANVQVL